MSKTFKLSLILEYWFSLIFAHYILQNSKCIWNEITKFYFPQAKNEKPVSRTDAFDYATLIGAKYIETSSRVNVSITTLIILHSLRSNDCVGMEFVLHQGSSGCASNLSFTNSIHNAVTYFHNRISHSKWSQQHGFFSTIWHLFLPSFFCIQHLHIKFLWVMSFKNRIFHLCNALRDNVSCWTDLAYNPYNIW